jgi:peptidyl-prolyl cis-trans isomerase SurA
MKGRGFSFGALILCSFAFFSFIAGASGAAEALQGAAPVAEVNQVPITTAAVDEALQAYLRRIGHRELSLSRMAALKREILERLIEDELIYQEGLKKGETVGDDELEAEAARLRNRFPSQEAFESALGKEKLSREQIDAGLRRFILIRKTWDAAGSMTDEEKRNWLKQIRERSEIKIY